MWRADMRVRMQTVRSLREAALRRDAWARWRQLYQSRLTQQRIAVRLVKRCFERWKDELREMDGMKERADQMFVASEGKVVVRCWDSWVRIVELRSAEREVSKRLGTRLVRQCMAFWRQRTCVCGHIYWPRILTDLFFIGVNTRRQPHFTMLP